MTSRTLTTVKLLLSLQWLASCHAFLTSISTTCSIDLPPVLSPKPRRPCTIGEKWPRNLSPLTRGEAIIHRRSESKLHQMDQLLHELCCAIVYCDDMALMEREMLQSNTIHLDLSSNLTRRPNLLRREVADIAARYGRPVSPLEHNWS